MLPDKRDAAYLFDMLQFAEEARALALDDAGDLRSRRAIERTISLIGEAANNVSREFQRTHPDVPWSDIIGQRHWLIHGYREVDLKRVRDVAENRLPPLIEQLRAMLPEPPDDPDPEAE
jgi:uncharacterized protein with HEPN domain